MIYMNKVLVKLYVPILEEEYEIWIPLNKRIINVIKLLMKSVSELSGGEYAPDKLPLLYDRATGMPFDVNSIVNDTSIRNGSEVILI